LNAGLTTTGIGRRIEDAALLWLGERGLRLRERNYRCRGGEIDLVMQDGDCVVFVEVRYRSSARFGSPAETVDLRKRQRLLRAARYYLQTHPDAGRAPARFDVVANRPGMPALEFEWIRNAFS
jgi:putative endonuclease